MSSHSWLAAAILLLMPLCANAQNSNDINAGVQFDFASPGAKSLAMGGAFVAIADDATSVFSNPAGMTQLQQPQVSGQLTHWQWRSSVVSAGHLFGTASGIGVDTVTGVVNQAFDGSDTAPSFFSFIYPLGNPVGRWRVGGFRHQLSKYQVNRAPQGAFLTCAGAIGAPVGSPPFCYAAARDGIERDFPKLQTISVDIVGTGGSLAYAVKPERLSIGISAQIATFRMDGTNTVFAAHDAQKFLAPNYANPANVELVSTQSGGDHALAINAGLLWMPLADRLHVGAAFASGPEFHFQTRTITGPANLGGAGIVGANDPANPFKVPDRYSAGLSFQPNPNANDGKWILTFETDRVMYSQLFSHFSQVSLPANDPQAQYVTRNHQIDNATELRGGVQFAHDFPGNPHVWRPAKFALRAGAFFDPQHQIYYTPDDPQTGYPTPLDAVLYPKANNDLHKSVGIGLAFRHLVFDAAFDFAEKGKTFGLSSVFYFCSDNPDSKWSRWGGC